MLSRPGGYHRAVSTLHTHCCSTWWARLRFSPGGPHRLLGPPRSWSKSSYKARQSNGIMMGGKRGWGWPFSSPPPSSWAAQQSLLLPIHLSQLCTPANGPISIKLQLPNCWCCISVRFPVIAIMRDTVLINNNYITVQDEEVLGNHSSIQLARSDLRLEIIEHLWM